MKATPTTDFASRNVAFTDVRACRELPEKSTSARSPDFVTRTWTRYSSSSAAPSASMIASPSHDAVRQPRRAPPHALGAGVADVRHRAEDRLGRRSARSSPAAAARPGRGSSRSSACRGQQVPEAAVVEDRASTSPAPACPPCRARAARRPGRPRRGSPSASRSRRAPSRPCRGGGPSASRTRRSRRPAKTGRMNSRSLTCVPVRYGSLAMITSPRSSFSAPYSSIVMRTDSVIVPVNRMIEFDTAGVR